ncbi:MAG: class I SAM-dependent methyltransferase [Proteobacteria bacterium]|nr:class I SAM-dependent methyltransferase [Pseudomonadota bacterium]
MNHTARRVNSLARRLNARRYLEIGVFTGLTFRAVEIQERTAVDPAFAFEITEVENDLTRCISTTSDDFFATHKIFPPYDIVFIDGLHTFEQVVRDLSNVILNTHKRSAILIDDTVPIDVYSAIPDQNAALNFRNAAGIDNSMWHGDVFKTVFYIHDFWPNLNYRTIMGDDNPQTLVWRSNSESEGPIFNSLEAISRLSYFNMRDNISGMRMASEQDAIDLCVHEIGSI